MRFSRFLTRYVGSAMAALAALCIGILIGSTAFVPEEEQVPSPAEPAQEAESVGNIGVMSILPDTDVVWKYRFAQCGHELTAENGVDLTGYTLADITAAYPDCRVTEMSAEHTAIERMLNEYCPEHYVLVWTEENTLSVFHTQAETMLVEELMQLALDPGSLDTALLEPLRSGMAFDSLMEINAYLEDAES